MSQMLQYKIASTLFKGVGPSGIKAMMAKIGGIAPLFEESTSMLKKAGLPAIVCDEKIRKQALEKAEKEIQFIQKNNIEALHYLDKDYPGRLKRCDDGPVVLYKKGNSNLNPDRCLSIVGTRKATEYGKRHVNKIVEDLQEANVTIVSGLAYGIDITAHRAALKTQLPTIAVLAQGLDQIYPKVHSHTAKEILNDGALISDFNTYDTFHPGNFPSRNRIIAGISDAVLVVESDVKGGSIITAGIANSYNRDVFALPGNTNQKYSSGCNNLIKTDRAQMIENAADILKFMSWEVKAENKKPVQRSFFVDLDETQTQVVNIIKGKAKISIDDIAIQSEINMGKLTATLLDLELKGVIQALPGKHFKLL